jgi:hypothetical protein
VTAGAVGVDLFPGFQEGELRSAAIEGIGMRDHVHRALQLLPLSLMAFLTLVVGHEARDIERRAVVGGNHRVAEGAHRRTLEQSRGHDLPPLLARAGAAKGQRCGENQEKSRAQDGSVRHRKLLSKRGKAGGMGAQ